MVCILRQTNTNRTIYYVAIIIRINQYTSREKEFVSKYNKIGVSEELSEIIFHEKWENLRP